MAQMTALFLVKYGDFFLVGLFFVLFVSITFLLLRAVILWYWKVDRVILLLEEIKAEIAQKKN